MCRPRAVMPPSRHMWQRGATAVEFALVLPLLLTMVFGVIDFGIFFGNTISLQSSAREGAREGVLLGNVIDNTRLARGLLDASKLQVRYVVDESAGEPGTMVVCVRYPQSSLTGFFNFVLNGVSESKTVMRMESTAPAKSGATSNWNGGTCSVR
ncbi:TadE/TadG family type IV pilus assembly protein [Tessaracoccus sp.]